MPLILRNVDKVSAGMWKFNPVLELESSVIRAVHSVASRLLQHSASRIKRLTAFILQDGGNLPVLRFLPLVLAVCW